MGTWNVCYEGDAQYGIVIFDRYFLSSITCSISHYRHIFPMNHDTFRIPHQMSVLTIVQQAIFYVLLKCIEIISDSVSLYIHNSYLFTQNKTTKRNTKIFHNFKLHVTKHHFALKRIE
jgi:hypothetical protein